MGRPTLGSTMPAQSAEVRAPTNDLDRLRAAIDASVAANERIPKSSAFLAICISNLTTIKDILGDQVARMVSAEVEKRLKRVMRSSDVIGQLSEGQIGIVLSRCQPDKVPTATRRFIAAATSGRVLINDTGVEVMVSVASVAFPDEELTSCDDVIAQVGTRLLHETVSRAPTVVQFNGGGALG